MDGESAKWPPEQQEKRSGVREHEVLYTRHDRLDSWPDSASPPTRKMEQVQDGSSGGAGQIRYAGLPLRNGPIPVSTHPNPGFFF